MHLPIGSIVSPSVLPRRFIVRNIGEPYPSGEPGDALVSCYNISCSKQMYDDIYEVRITVFTIYVKEGTLLLRDYAGGVLNILELPGRFVFNENGVCMNPDVPLSFTGKGFEYKIKCWSKVVWEGGLMKGMRFYTNYTAQTISGSGMHGGCHNGTGPGSMNKDEKLYQAAKALIEYLTEKLESQTAGRFDSELNAARIFLNSVSQAPLETTKHKRGRPAGIANKGKVLRNERYNFRCSKDFKEVLHILSTEGALCKGKSESDIIHSALRMYAIQHVPVQHIDKARNI